MIFDLEDENIILKKKMSGLDIFAEFINAVKNKKKFPEKTDWDKEYSSQFE